MTDSAHVSTKLNVSCCDDVSRSSKKIPPMPLLSPTEESKFITTYYGTISFISALHFVPGESNQHQYLVIPQETFEIIPCFKKWPLTIRFVHQNSV